MPSLYEVSEVVEDGKRKAKLTLNLHQGQARVWVSSARIVAACAGTQSGKTAMCPLWLWREIKLRGPGDYGFICPTFSLMELKALPEFKALFERVFNLGHYQGSPVRKFTFSKDGSIRHFGYDPGDVQTHVYFGYAENPDSLESSTYKAIVCDEAGQKAFKGDSWDALQRRLSIHQGRALIATTPYGNTGWLKTRIYDSWKAGNKDIDFIQFASNMNPAFPPDEFERKQRELPRWKFNLFYRGIFDKPAGLIYDNFDEDRFKIPRFKIDDNWRRYLGLDFGGVNTVGVFFAEEPKTGILYAYREYHAGRRTAREHVVELRKGEPRLPVCFGGSKSEGQWRDEFRAAGLPVQEPGISSVEVGIDRVYGAHTRGEIYVFSDLEKYLDQKLTYSRKVDDRGEPTEEIDDKSSYHFCFIAGTMIATARGEVPIEEVRLTDLCLTRSGWFPVVATLRHRPNELREVVFVGGNRLVGTPDHPIWVDGAKDFVPIEDLAKWPREEPPFVDYIRHVVPAGAVVYNLTVSHVHEYFANGILVANCDAERYIVSHLKKPLARGGIGLPLPGEGSMVEALPAGVFG